MELLSLMFFIVSSFRASQRPQYIGTDVFSVRDSLLSNGCSSPSFHQDESMESIEAERNGTQVTHPQSHSAFNTSRSAIWRSSRTTEREQRARSEPAQRRPSTYSTRQSQLLRPSQVALLVRPLLSFTTLFQFEMISQIAAILYLYILSETDYIQCIYKGFCWYPHFSCFFNMQILQFFKIFNILNYN